MSGGQHVAGVVDLDVQHVLVADQAGDGGVGGGGYEVGAGGGLAQLAVDQHGHAVGEGEHLVGAVGYEDDGRRAVGQGVFDVGEERGAGGGVESCGGFVEQQRVGRAGQGSREADSLGL